MALAIRHRWMLYGLAALLTVAAMVAVQPSEDAGEVPAALPSGRFGRAERDTSSVPDLPLRSYAGSGRSPFGDAVAGGATQAAHAPPSASPPAPMAQPVPASAAAAEVPFVFLGRWTEEGETAVFLSHGDRRLTAQAGRLLTPEYRVESIGERELRVLHLPTGTRRTLALASGSVSAPTNGVAPTVAPPEELN